MEAKEFMKVDGMADALKMHGALTLTLTKKDGTVDVLHKDNIIVNAGFDLICDALGNAGARPGVIGYIGVGTGNAAPAPTDTTLGTPTLRKAAAYAHTAGTKTFTMTTTFEPGEATAALTEAGVFNAASGGTMLDRVTFPVVNKGIDDTLQAVFTFTLS